MGKSKIEWTDRVWNPTRGCERVSPECENCYAERYAARFNQAGQPFEGLAQFTPSGPRWTRVVRMHEEFLERPLRWRKPSRVFVNSMSDLFHKAVTNDFIMRVFMTMAQTSRHEYTILTKRARRMFEWFSTEEAEEAERFARVEGVAWPLSNVIVGVSAGTQERVDAFLPYLIRTPAATRLVSAEPLIGEVRLSVVKCPRSALSGCVACPISEICEGGFFNALPFLGWVITGGESGVRSRIRPMDEDWVRILRDECAEGGVPFFYKQRIDEGRKVSLPVLDESTHEEFPSERRI